MTVPNDIINNLSAVINSITELGKTYIKARRGS